MVSGLNPIGSIFINHPQFRVTSCETKTCQKHGEYQQINYESGRRTSCPKCVEEREQQRLADEKALQQQINAERKSKLTDQLIGNSGIPKRFLGKTLKSYQVKFEEQKPIVNSAVNFAKEFQQSSHSGRCLIFIGNAGTGKTHIGCAIGLHVIKNCGGTARFTSVSEINRLVRESKSFNSEYTETEIIDAFGNYDLLIVDEVGIQSGTDAESRALFDVFNARYQNVKPTIVISNLTKDQLTVALGERIVDRLKEGGGEILSFNWQSYRG